MLKLLRRVSESSHLISSGHRHETLQYHQVFSSKKQIYPKLGKNIFSIYSNVIHPDFYLPTSCLFTTKIESVFFSNKCLFPDPSNYYMCAGSDVILIFSTDFKKVFEILNSTVYFFTRTLHQATSIPV